MRGTWRAHGGHPLYDLVANAAIPNIHMMDAAGAVSLTGQRRLAVIAAAAMLTLLQGQADGAACPANVTEGLGLGGGNIAVDAPLCYFEHCSSVLHPFMV